MSIRILIVSFILSVAIASCKDNSFNSLEKQSRYHFVFKPEPGNKYYYDFNNHTESEQQVNDEWKKVTNTSEMGIVYEVGQDSLGNYILHISFDKMKLAVKKSDGSEKEIDVASAASSFDPADKPFALFKDARFTVTLNRKQEIVSLQGYDEFIKKLKNSFVSDERGRQVVDAALNQLMGPDFIRQSIGQQFKLFPDSSLTIGNTWKKQADDHTGMSIHVQDVYTLESVKNGIANVHINCDIKTEGQKLKVAGFDASVSITGNRSGEIEADIKTGMLIKSKIGQTIKGEIEVLGKDVPIKIQSTFEIVKRS